MRALVPEDFGAVETASRRAAVGDFVKCCQLTALGGLRALDSPEGLHATERVTRVLKAAVTPLNTTTGAAVAPDLAVLGEAFASTLQGVSVFDTMLANGMRRVPLKQRGIIISTTASGSVVAERSPKPISELSLAGATLDPQKCWAAVAVTKELLDFSRPGAADLFRSELQKAVVAATDSAFLAGLRASTTPTASNGSTFANTMKDLTALLAAVDIGPTSKVYWVLTTTRAKSLALMLTGTGGMFAFPNLTVIGGTIAGGIEVMVSDALPANSSLLIVADGLVGNAAGFELKQIRQGDIMLNTSPDSPSTAATVLRNLWQMNAAALAVERYFAFEVVRARSVASLSY